MKKLTIIILLLLMSVSYATPEKPEYHVFPLPFKACVNKYYDRIELTTTFYDVKSRDKKEVLKKGRQHWDIPVVIGTEIYAPEDGIVTETGYETGHAGQYIKILTDDEYLYVIGHLRAKNGLVYVKGQRVKRGSVIAYSGNTGNSTGPHLHLQAYKDGKPIPPLSLFGKAYKDRAYRVRS